MPLVLPSNLDLHHRIDMRVVAVHLQQSTGKNPNYDSVTCLQLLVSTAISGKLASGISTTPMTELCLYYLRLKREQ